MATKPTLQPIKPAPRFSATAIAIAVSFLISVVLATVVAGNPFHAARMAYHDYGATPREAK